MPTYMVSVRRCAPSLGTFRRELLVCAVDDAGVCSASLIPLAKGLSELSADPGLGLLGVYSLAVFSECFEASSCIA